MCRIRTCCCCLNLRQGSYVSAVYSILVGGFGVFGNVIQLRRIDSEGAKYAEETPDEDEHEILLTGQRAKITMYIALGLFAAWVLTAIFIFCGIKSRVRGFLLPWIIVASIIMGLSAYSIGISILKIKDIVKDTIELTEFCIYCGVFIINIYAVLCVAAYYRAHLLLEEDEDIPEAMPMKGDAYYGPDAV